MKQLAWGIVVLVLLGPVPQWTLAQSGSVAQGTRSSGGLRRVFGPSASPPEAQVSANYQGRRMYFGPPRYYFYRYIYPRYYGYSPYVRRFYYYGPRWYFGPYWGPGGYVPPALWWRMWYYPGWFGTWGLGVRRVPSPQWCPCEPVY